MGKVIVNDTNMENLGTFIATQARFNQAMLSTIEAILKKYQIDEDDKYNLIWAKNELENQNKCQWDIGW